MKNAFIEHLKKEKIGIGPIYNSGQWQRIIQELDYNRVYIETTWTEATQNPDMNFIILGNHFVLDFQDEASKYITTEQFFNNINKESDWQLN